MSLENYPLWKFNNTQNIWINTFNFYLGLEVIIERFTIPDNDASRKLYQVMFNTNQATTEKLYSNPLLNKTINKDVIKYIDGTNNIHTFFRADRTQDQTTHQI